MKCSVSNVVLRNFEDNVYICIRCGYCSTCFVYSALLKRMEVEYFVLISNLFRAPGITNVIEIGQNSYPIKCSILSPKSY